MAADAGFPMGFQSIFAWKALPEAAFVKKTVIDAHRSKHESIASGWLHRSARPILPQTSPVWKVWNLQIVSFEHAKASAALAASCKRACGKSRLVTATWRLSGRITVAGNN
jgi:hypothetical protein